MSVVLNEEITVGTSKDITFTTLEDVKNPLTGEVVVKKGTTLKGKARSNTATKSIDVTSLVPVSKTTSINYQNTVVADHFNKGDKVTLENI